MLVYGIDRFLSYLSRTTVVFSDMHDNAMDSLKMGRSIDTCDLTRGPKPLTVSGILLEQRGTYFR